MTAPYQIVIGLEVHVQLQTETKLFCRCSTQFGAAPNTQTCPVCLGLPGALPVLNRKAFEFSLKTALALNCEIPPLTKWDRKNYYYPDLPKGYQISQFDLPLSQNGFLAISDPQGEFDGKRIGIIRAHLEEDAGKSMHDEGAGRSDSRIDLNRAGTPLLEIVSQPDLRSPREAKAYLTELKLLLEYLRVSDCNMQEGSLRVDANINLHVADPQGGKPIATPIVEIKNMNSFRAVERALAFEGERLYHEWLDFGKRLGEVPKQTRGWDDQAQITRPQRGKEESSDYRYFPDPDLAPVRTTPAQIAQLRESLGELPADLRRRFQQQYELDLYDAEVLVNQGPELAAYFESVAVTCGEPKRASNWMQGEVLRVMNERGIGIGQFPIGAPSLGELLVAIRSGDIDNSRAKEVFAGMLESGRSAKQEMESRGIAKADAGEVEALCRELVAANPRIAADVRGGKEQAVGAMVGQAKKKNPNADPGQVRRICLEIIRNGG